jgi:hypothetical protein
MNIRPAPRLPLPLKLIYTLFVAVLVPFYWINYGPQNFLWFCDVAMLMTLPALWLENRLLASMPAVGILLPQAAWVVDFFAKLFAGSSFFGIADYMFNPQIPLFVRGLSSFHGWLPFLLLWMVWRLGYDCRALLWQTALGCLLLVLSFLLTAPPPPPADNPNWAVNVNSVFGQGDKPQTMMSPVLYLAAQMVFYPVCFYVPTHFLLRWLAPVTRSAPGGTLNKEAPENADGNRLHSPGQ